MKITDLYSVDQIITDCLAITDRALSHSSDQLRVLFPNTETRPVEIQDAKEVIFSDLSLYHLYMLIFDDDVCKSCIFEFKEYEIFELIPEYLDAHFISTKQEHPYFQWTDKERKIGLRTQHFTLITGEYNSELWKEKKT